MFSRQNGQSCEGGKEIGYDFEGTVLRFLASVMGCNRSMTALCHQCLKSKFGGNRLTEVPSECLDTPLGRCGPCAHKQVGQVESLRQVPPGTFLCVKYPKQQCPDQHLLGERW